MRILIALVPMLFAPLVADALGFVISDIRSTGASTTELASGDVITFDLRLENPDFVPLNILGAVAFDYDDGLRFEGGEAANSFFNPFLVAGVVPFGGFPNTAAPMSERLFFTGVRSPGDTELGLGVRVLSGIRVNPITADGSNDRGIDGRLISEGDVHLRLSFRAIEVEDLTEVTIQFGNGDPTASGRRPTWGEVAQGPDGRVPFENAAHRLLVRPTEAIPEPGAALLFAAGMLVASFRRG